MLSRTVGDTPAAPLPCAAGHYFSCKFSGSDVSTHGNLFEAPGPRAKTEPMWPGYDSTPAKDSRLSMFAWLFRRRSSPRHAA
jgi:hypothetical protein